MQVILRGSSAAELWRFAAEHEAEELRAREERWLRGDMDHDELSSSCASMLLQQQRCSAPQNYVPHISAGEAQALAARWGLTLPLRVHAQNPNQSRSSSVATTVLGAIPVGHLVLLEPGVWVISPEMCLADLAKDVYPLALLMCAFELCGHFVVGADDKSKPARRARHLWILRRYVTSLLVPEGSKACDLLRSMCWPGRALHVNRRWPRC